MKNVVCVKLDILKKVLKMINNTNTTELVHVLVYVGFGFGIVLIVLAVIQALLYWYIRNVDIKLQAMTPESRALAHAYYTMLYEEHRKNKEYDERLDKMFEEEKGKELTKLQN